MLQFGNLFLKSASSRLPGLLMICLGALVLAGCGGGKYASPNPQKRFVFPGEEGGPPPTQTAPAQPAPSVAVPAVSAPVPVPVGTPLGAIGTNASGSVGGIQVGDSITVNFTDLPPSVQPIMPYVSRIGEDGNITLHMNVTVKAAGKTARDLEQEIRTNYVPRYYKNLTVTVKTEERFYFVGGEVKMPARQPYFGRITVLRAIDTAGGFTDFANRSKIELTRHNGQKIKINWKKAIKDPKLDPEVFPNDQINVPKSW